MVLTDSADSLVDASDGKEAPRGRRKAVVVAAGAAALLMACGAVWATYLAVKAPLTARQLLENAETAEIMTDNLMVLENHPASDRDEVHADVVRRLREKMRYLREQEPETYKRLNSMEISDERKVAYLHHVRRLGDVKWRQGKLFNDHVDEWREAAKQWVEERRKAKALENVVEEDLESRLRRLQFTVTDAATSSLFDQMFQEMQDYFEQNFSGTSSTGDDDFMSSFFSTGTLAPPTPCDTSECTDDWFTCMENAMHPDGTQTFATCTNNAFTSMETDMTNSHEEMQNSHEEMQTSMDNYATELAVWFGLETSTTQSTIAGFTNPLR